MAAKEFKKVGLFGSTSNAVKATAASVETIASGVNQAAAIGLLKIQIEGMESAKEAGFSCNNLTEYQALMQESLEIARMAYK